MGNASQMDLSKILHGKTFKIVCAVNSKCLNANSETIKNPGTKIELWDNAEQKSQLWKFEHSQDGNYTIHCIENDWCLDADPGTLPENGTRLQLWNANKGKNQDWKIEALGEGRFLIRDATNNRCLDASNGAFGINNNGNPVTLWDYHGGDNQQWILQKVKKPVENKPKSKFVYYRITTHIADVWLAGTDNKVDMTLVNEEGVKSIVFRIPGWNDRNGTYIYNTPNTVTDIGGITKIIIDVDGVLADKVYLDNIIVDRMVAGDDKPKVDGTTNFVINKELGYDAETFESTSYVAPHKEPIILDQEIVTENTYYTLTFNNLAGSTDQNNSKYGLTWSDEHTLTFTETSQNSIGVTMGVSYDFTKVFKANLSTTFSHQWTEAKARAEAIKKGFSYEWTLKAAAGTYTFNRKCFIADFDYKLYQDRDSNILIRELSGNSQIPLGTEISFEIPQKNGEDINPVDWDILEEQFIQYMVDKTEVENLRNNLKPEWISKRWVMHDSGCSA